MDDVPGIRWLAGEGLINLKQDALIPILKGLQVNFHSTFFLEGAHHGLRELEREGILNEKLLEALEAPEGTAAALTVPFVAAEALHFLTVVDLYTSNYLLKLDRSVLGFSFFVTKQFFAPTQELPLWLHSVGNPDTHVVSSHIGPRRLSVAK